MDNRTPEEWLMALKSGTEALEPIYRAYGKELYIYAYTIIRDEGVANDAVSETMIRLVRLADRYRPDGNARAYLFRVCKLVSLELARRHRRDIPSDTLPEESATDCVGDARLFADQLLDRLSVKDRQILVLHYYEDMTFHEIAQIMGMPEGTVKWRHTKALALCRSAV